MGLMGERQGRRFSRSPFSRPICDECGGKSAYGSVSIRVEISRPTADVNDVLARGVFDKKTCAMDWLSRTKVDE